MKKRVVFKFSVFDESIKQIAKEVVLEFPGVRKVIDVEGEAQLEVRGDFNTFELTNELKKIDESVETFKIRPHGVTEPEVKLQPQDEGKRPINREEVFRKPSTYDDSSSTRTGYGLWEQAKGVAVVAAEKAIDIGVGAAKLIPRNSYEQQSKPEPKQGGGHPRRSYGEPELNPQKKRGIIDGVKEYFERKKRQEEDRLLNERLKKQDMDQRKLMMELARKRDLAKNSEGGTSRTLGSTAMDTLGSLWNTTMRPSVASGSTSTNTLRTGEASASTQENRRKEKRKKEAAAKKGKDGN